MADGSVGKALRYGAIEPWRLKNKITFCQFNTEELPNGVKTRGAVPVPDFTLHCADFRVSLRDMPGLSGPNRDSVSIVAVRHKPNRVYDKLLALYKGEEWIVDLVMTDFSKLRGYDLIALRKKDSNE